MNLYHKKFIMKVVVLLLLTTAMYTAAEHAVRRPVHIAGGHQWGLPVVGKMLRTFCEERNVPVESFTMERWADRDCTDRFADGESNILVHYALVDITSKTEKRDEAEPYEKFIIGQARAAVVAHPRSRVRQMTTDEVRDILRSSTRAEREADADREVYYGESRWQSVSSHVVRRAIMLIDGQYYGRFTPFRRDMEVCRSPRAVADKIAENPDAIGTLLWQGREITGVRVVEIGATEDGPFVAPSTKPIIQEDYPLSEYLVLYLRPGAPELARKFARFASGEEGSKIAAAEGLVTPYQQHQYEAKKRMQEARRGGTEEITAVAMGDGRELLRDLSEHYVRAKAPLRLRSSVRRHQLSAVEDFFGRSFLESGDHTDALDLLLLEGRPDAEVMKAYGDKWNELMPEEHMLGGRAVGVIVNPANELESLTLGQVRAIFSGETRDWTIIGGTGLPSDEDGDIPIRTAALPSRNPAAEVFYRHGVPRRELRVTREMAGTIEAVKAVSMTPGAIAFVDLQRIPEAGQTVRVLPIRLGPGADARVVRPTPENVRTGMYPLSERLFLYVHPQAGERAEDFARFAASCGESVATPYADTVSHVKAVFRNYGLVPVRLLIIGNWE